MICMDCKYYDAEHTICRNKKARYVGCDECFKWEKKKPTNADRVRSMSDEELAEWYWQMLKYTQGYTDSRWALLDWLKKESE